MQGAGFAHPSRRFRVQGSGFRVQGSGLRVQGSGFRVYLSFSQAVNASLGQDLASIASREITLLDRL